jgi:hypothetical protein
MNNRLVTAAAVAGILATSGATVIPALAVAPTAQRAAVQLAPACSPDDLYVVKGRLEGAAGGRYLKVRIRNVGDGPCTAGLATRAGFRDWSGELGAKGLLSTGGGTITMNQGGTARTTIHWADPGPVPQADCQAAVATLVTLRLPSLRHTWRLPLRAQVCTTAAYAPDSKPLH